MKQTLLITLVLLSVTVFAQKIKVVEGSLAPLAGEKVIKTEFTYDNMLIGKDDISEADYIRRKKSDYNVKEAGKGDQWEKAWFSDRAARFEPQFKELFEKYGQVATAGESKYTLIFKTTNTEPGWNVGVMRVPARINAEVVFVETANPSTVVARITLLNAPGQDAMGYDFDSGYRIQEAYAKSGKELGKLLVKSKK